MMFVSN